MPLNILFPDSRFERLDVERDVTGPDTILNSPRKDRFDAIELGAWENCDGIVVTRMPIDAGVVSHLKRARIVVRHGVGFDTVDIAACGEAGIAVCNVPDYGTTDVADSAIAMMLAFARGVAALDGALRTDLKGGWTTMHSVTARRLRGACFGVIGLGRIGTAAALRAHAFGMDVAFYDPYLPSGADLALGFSRARSLHELLARADVVSIHAPLTHETRAMIDAQAIAQIKPGAYLINTARGPICDTRALLDGLKSGRLLAAGLDVLPKEPATPDDPLVAAWQADEDWLRGRVLLNPHAAFCSPASLADLRRKAIETAFDYLHAGRLANCVNAEYLKQRR
ncbi:MAG: C-terminal binding protein [Betaproteobacteria bacterium]|nr:C-terminal binding protein [Betaproteobacteria bacterium]